MRYLVLLAAIALVESHNTDSAIGKLGEISRYQIRPHIWRAYSKSRAYRNPKVAQDVALKLVKAIENALPVEHRTERDILVCYNWGIGNYRRARFNYTRVPIQVQRYAEKVMQIYAKNSRPAYMGVKLMVERKVLSEEDAQLKEWLNARTIPVNFQKAIMPHVLTIMHCAAL